MGSHHNPNGGYIFRVVTRIVFTLLLVSMVSFTYPADNGFFSRLLLRIHSLFFEAPKRMVGPKYSHPRYVTAQDTVRKPFPPPPPPPPDSGN